MGADGQLADPVPNAILGLKTSRTGSRLRLAWSYCPLDQQAAPRTLNVYWDNGTGQVAFAEAVAVLPYKGRRLYDHQSELLQDGRYLFAVRAEAIAPGGEGATCSPAALGLAEVKAAAPDAPMILAAETV
jgi:hypothetical protein